MTDSEWVAHLPEVSVLVRVFICVDGSQEIHSTQDPKTLVGFDELLAEKLALLKVANVGARVDNIGWRRASNIFYIHIYNEEFEQYELQLRRGDKSNGVPDG